MIVVLIAFILVVGYFLFTFILGSFAEVKSFRKKMENEKNKSRQLYELKTNDREDFALHYKLSFDSFFQDNKTLSINDLKEKLKRLFNYSDKECNGILIKAIESNLLSSETEDESETAKIRIKGYKYTEVAFFYPNYKSFVQQVCLKMTIY